MNSCAFSLSFYGIAAVSCSSFDPNSSDVYNNEMRISTKFIKAMTQSQHVSVVDQSKKDINGVIY